MDPMHPFHPRRLKPAAGDKVDADGEDLARGVEINAPHVPRFGNAESRFKQLVLHPRAFASMAECSTMPHSAWLDCMVRRLPSRGSLRRASPALDRAHRTLLNLLKFQKRHDSNYLNLKRIKPE